MIMGYTHFFHQRRNVSPLEWMNVSAMARRIIAASPAPLAREYDTPDVPPVVSQTLIAFNGIGSDGHETFYLPRERPPQKTWEALEDRGFMFCKTNMKPYDVAVVAMLHVLHEVCPSAFVISSDGDEGDLAEGRGLAEACFGRPVGHPVKAGAQ
jgi:hypothetical protein